MSIVNRDNHISQQRECIHLSEKTLVTGSSYCLAVIPYPCNVQALQTACIGVSGAPALMFNAVRATSGGQTVIALGVSTLLPLNYGTSGPQGWSGLQTIGSSLLQLQKGDMITVYTSVANTAIDKVAVDLIVQKSQDIVSHLGLSV